MSMLFICALISVLHRLASIARPNEKFLKSDSSLIISLHFRTNLNFSISYRIKFNYDDNMSRNNLISSESICSFVN